jgi:hypothetical protein
MIYIGTTEFSGQAIYLDIHAIEQVADGVRVSAVIGDGCYEGEVLIESGQRPAVTYADAWLGGAGLGDFLQRCGRHWLQQQLFESIQERVGAMNGSRGRHRPSVLPHPPHRRRTRIAEPAPFWTTPT